MSWTRFSMYRILYFSADVSLTYTILIVQLNISFQSLRNATGSNVDRHCNNQKMFSILRHVELTMKYCEKQLKVAIHIQ